ncbi:MAG TPA: rod shape-determining protein MreC [Candidatus Angelobacter sp.]|jgi:rod shape-determining protein MreC|nr:rod shape-determining protein MreC [Candidatus Angelobacter sp.]
MENFFSRYKNPLALMAVLFIQVVGLATQVKRPEGAKPGTTGSGTRLIRVWTVTAFTPIEKMFVSTGHFFSNGWHNYADLRGVRKQNRELQDEVARLQMEQVRLKQDADQARRLQVLLDFKEKFISKTVAAQVIGTSGTEQSRVIIIDKGSRDGIKQDMAVITPDGIVGKIKDVFPLSSQVLLINDHDSGAGVILEHSRLQSIVKGTPLGELQINDIMSDEKVEPGERVITSGGDRIYPKGYAVGTVTASTPDKDNDPFLAIKIKPAADLSRLEEVLVITKMAEDTKAGEVPTPMRAADILSQRLPSVPKQDPNAPKVPGGIIGAPAATSSPTPVKANKPAGTGTEQKPGIAANPLKPPLAGTGTTLPATDSPKRSATGITPAMPGSSANKAGAETKKPPSTGAGTATPAGTGGATPDATATPPKPKPTPKATPKKTPAIATDSNTPGASAPKISDQSGTNAPAATSAATPSPTPEKPPR